MKRVILLQSIPTTLDLIKARIKGDAAERIEFTSEYRRALDIVIADRHLPGRTVIVSSAEFHSTEDDPGAACMTGEVLAGAVKGIDPRAWFFFYAQSPLPCPFVDGRVPKAYQGNELVYDKIVQFLSLDFASFSTIDELRRRVPWLE